MRWKVNITSSSRWEHIEVDGSDWEIADAIFDCEELTTCEMTCDDPRREVLAPATEKCGCAIEWFLHSEWLGNGLVFFLYFFMNVTRLFFIAGLTRLLWKFIYPERFTVLITFRPRPVLHFWNHF